MIEAAQYERIRPLQAECRRFACDAEAFFRASGKRPNIESLRLAAMARLLFFPSAAEVSYLEGFRLDMNLATLDSFELFDCDKGLEALRRRGAFFMQPGSKTLRTNYPIELRSAGIELSLALFAHHRYGFGVTLDDTGFRKETLELLVADGRHGSLTTLEARATHDGFFSLEIPLGNGGFAVGVLFGKKYEWVQIDSVEILPTGSLYDSDAAENAFDASETLRFDEMRHASDGLFECLSESGFMMLTPVRPSGVTGTLACPRRLPPDRDS
jgi:hypothetical protein